VYLILIALKLPFHIVDVFAEEKLQGNQLAVFKDEEGVSSDLMQRIAKEMNYSESTFITAVDTERHVYKVRIFTPESELPFAGHPTLGTAYVIQQTIIQGEVPSLTLDLPAGMIPVTFSYVDGEPDVLWMRQLNPVFGRIHPPEPIAEIIGLRPDDIDPDYPVQEVSTGVPFFMIPLKDGDALKRVKLDAEKLKVYTRDTDAKWPHMFCREPVDPENHLKCRMITTFTEDPATGSANGCLAGYLVKHRYLDADTIDVRVEQGAEIGRPSLIYLRAAESGRDEIEVNVGGRCAMVAQGRLV
jgi:trans-2,3-dihydro-3-hydroxyanthranilate isomerase